MERTNRSVIFAAMSLLAATAANADVWYFDFGTTATPTTNFNSIVPGTDSYVLTNDAGAITAASLFVPLPFNGTDTAGTTLPADLGYPSSATRDSLTGNSAAPHVQLQFNGLDPMQHYDFTFFASRTSVTDNRETQYTVTGGSTQTAALDPVDNTAGIVSTCTAPDATGAITLDVQAGPANTNASRLFHLNAMKVVGRPADDPALDDKLTKYPADAAAPYPLGHYLYRPAGYSGNPCKQYPLLVWMHGLGEICSSTSIEALVNRSALNSPGRQIIQGTAYRDGRPFLDGLVAMPQTCRGGGWSSAEIDATIEYVKRVYRVDEDRIYITGLSLGAGGTWTYAASKPTKIAAIVPIAGTEKNLSQINAASHVPIWAFHNYNDTNKKSTSVGPETDLFRCKSHTPRECTIEHIDRMIPFATTKVMEGYSANGGATMASTDRTAALVNTTSTLLPTEWRWSAANVPSDSDLATSKSIMTIFAASGHQGWFAAYGMQQMWTWLYNQKRATSAPLRINTPTIAPVNTPVNGGATVTLSAKLGLSGAAVDQVWVDLKDLGGSNAAPMTYNSVSKAYELQHVLPVAGLKAGTKGIGIVAIDTNGNRQVRHVTITLDP